MFLKNFRIVDEEHVSSGNHGCLEMHNQKQEIQTSEFYGPFGMEPFGICLADKNQLMNFHGILRVFCRKILCFLCNSN